MTIFSLLALCLALSASAQQELSEDNAPASVAGTAKSCADGIQAPPGRFCDSVAECRQFCGCACSFDKNPWDGSLKCANIPAGGPGMLPRESPEMLVVPKMKFVWSKGRIRAAKVAVEGLQRLNEALKVSENRKNHGYSVRINSCWRSHVGDTDRECGFVIKGRYILENNKGTEQQRKDWEVNQDPNNVGLAWPGRTPHSAGYACDLILVDSKGEDCFDCRAGVKGAPTCSLIDQRLASQMLDQELDAAGAVRLSYEAWHYEWDADPPKNRCKAGDCATKFWPLPCKPFGS